MNQKAVIEKLIAELNLTMTRPTMFMGETTVRGTQIYLSGMYSALVAMGLPSTLDTRIQAIKSRGWEFSAIGAVADMQKHNLSEEQMVQELLLIEIKMLEIVAEGMQDLEPCVLEPCVETHGYTAFGHETPLRGVKIIPFRVPRSGTSWPKAV